MKKKVKKTLLTDSTYYYLDANNKIVVCHDVVEWARNFDALNKQVALTEIPVKYGTKTWNVVVSTVFLGLDYSFGGTNPILFETMIYDDPSESGDRFWEFQNRYNTYEEACNGHAALVQLLQSNNIKISPRKKRV